MYRFPEIRSLLTVPAKNPASYRAVPHISICLAKTAAIDFPSVAGDWDAAK